MLFLLENTLFFMSQEIQKPDVFAESGRLGFREKMNGTKNIGNM